MPWKALKRRMHMKCKYCQKEISPNQLSHHEKGCKLASEFKDTLSLKDLKNIDLESLPIIVLKKCKVELNCDTCNRLISKSLAAWRARPSTTCAMCHRKDHLLEKYGVTNVAQLESTREKYKQTCLQKFGVEHASQSSVIKEKLWTNRSKEEASKVQRDIWKEREIDGTKTQIFSKAFETRSNFSDERKKEIKEKAKQTCKERYGADYWQCSEIFKIGLRERISKACKKYQYGNITFDSSWELALWIYAKDYDEEIEREPCQFEYEYNGAAHTYIPDFRYKGKLLEIKGDHYKDDQTKAKLLVAEKSGIQVLYQKDVKVYLDYCRNKFKSKFWYRKYKNK